MEQNEERRTINRRRLLRRAGTVAATVAGAGAVASIATPAFANDTDPLVIGQANTGTLTTKLTAGSTANPTLRLENSTTGSGLSVKPLTTTIPDPNDPDTWTFPAPSTQPPVGSLYTDDWGDVYGVGQPGGGALGGKYVNQLYSPTWATMVVPITPIRYVDTRFASLRTHLVPGSTTLDGAGRVVPKGSTSVPDMVVDLSPLFSGGFGAVQANLTALLPLERGFAALWDTGNWPGTSSVNFAPVIPEIANFTQTKIGPDRTIRLKTNQSCQFILDIVGFVVADPFSQLAGGGSAPSAAAASAAQSMGGWHKRPPVSG